MNSKYLKGRSAEYEVRDLLTREGFFVVRAAGSKSIVDLVAVPYLANNLGYGCRPVLAQVKRGAASASKFEKEKLRNFASEIIAEVRLYHRKDRKEWKYEVF